MPETTQTVYLPSPSAIISQETISKEMLAALHYTMDEVFRKTRGEFEYDDLFSRFIITLDLSDVDRRLQVVFAAQKAKRVILVTKSYVGGV